MHIAYGGWGWDFPSSATTLIFMGWSGISLINADGGEKVASSSSVGVKQECKDGGKVSE